ncbi:MAG: AAA family ATPase [Myxococcales bacterium]|nr:AAA family ATPase [Myxococcales bacterium]
MSEAPQSHASPPLEVFQKQPEEAYLLIWNPKRYEWPDLDEQIAALEKTGTASGRWSCGNVRHIPLGSRVFLTRVNEEPRGLVGAGYITRSPYEETHWNDAQAKQGRVARFVDVRFDFLSRTPLIRRKELDTDEFAGGNWDAQMSGTLLADQVTKNLEKEWQLRVRARERGESIPPVTTPAIEDWRRHWDNAQQDELWIEGHHVRDRKRLEILPLLADLVKQFTENKISFDSFRNTFYSKVQNEWNVLGLNAYSGAKYLNDLHKYLSGDNDFPEQLRAAYSLPQSAADARAKIKALIDYLERQVAAGIATKRQLQPKRVPFLASAFWHFQQPDAWPLFYSSAREALQADGLLGRVVERADGYLEFARVFTSLAKGVGITFWELEHLCERLVSATPGKDVEPDAAESSDEARPRERVWLYQPGPGGEYFEEFYKEGILAIGWDFLGDLSTYADVRSIRQAIQEYRGGGARPINAGWACYQFCHEMEVGDIVFAKQGTHNILGYGIVSSEYRFDPQRKSFQHVRSIDWKTKGPWIRDPSKYRFVTKTLTDIGRYPDLVADIRQLLGLGDSLPPAAMPSAYTLADARDDLFLPEATVTEAEELLRHKKNLILQGPPGVGKTYFAKRLAYLLLEAKDLAQIGQVQFHQSYAYEDFIQGYRPTDGGKFERIDGPFLRFCKSALQDPTSPYVFIIDEINRGNLSKIFGELLLLLEADKRAEDWSISLAYSKEGERFYVPDNVYIIGTMNTADRSLAMVDYALRRRFAFVDVPPGYRQDAFRNALERIGADSRLRDLIISRLTRLNEQIEADPNLGSGFCIGHSYFCRSPSRDPDPEWYQRIVRTELKPLLREYWFDQPERAQDEVDKLLSDT